MVVRQTAAQSVQPRGQDDRGVVPWNRHRPITEQHATLSQKLRGHYGYYGITGNGRALATLRYVVTGVWRKWLSRRSWAGYFSWERFERLLKAYALPPPVVVHSVYRATANL